MPDPLICARCGGPKVHDDMLCPACAAVVPTDADEVGFDDPPPGDIPQAFGEGAD